MRFWGDDSASSFGLPVIRVELAHSGFPDPDFWTIIEKADSPAGGCSGLLLYGAISHQLIVFVPYEFAKDEWLTPRGM